MTQQQVSLERFSELIGAIYDCVITPEGWAIVLEDIRREFGFVLGILSAGRLPNEPLRVNAVAGFDRAQLAQEWAPYRADIAEIWGGANRLQQFPIGEPIIQSQAVSREITLRNRFYREWIVPRNQTDSVIVSLASEGTLVGAISFAQHESAGVISDRQVSGLRLIAPHVRRAVMISDLFDMKSVEAATFAATVEVLKIGVLLTDEYSKVIHTNTAAAAILAAGDPIMVRQGRISVKSPTTTGTLQSAVAQAAKDEVALGQKGIGIPVLRADGEPMVIHVLPLRQSQLRSGLVPSAAVALFVTPASSPPRLPHDALTQLYDLTPAEVRIFELICEGQTPTAIAALLGIADSTVRTHLLRVFDKTGSKRQLDLVRLARTLTFPV